MAGASVSERKTRIELFIVLRSLAEIVPEMRAGQIMAALGELCAGIHGRGLWEAEDAELMETMWEFRRGVEATTGVTNGQLAAS